jgi:Zn finger protein HypA/HybF involved in hydrogenase expression
MKIKNYTTEDVRKAVESSFSLCEVLRKLGYVATAGGNYKTVRKIIKDNSFSISHFRKSGWPIGKESHNARPLEELLKENSLPPTTALKERIIKRGLLPNKCADCGIGPEWNGKPLKLQLDHKNGNKYDNRIENLRLLCPNCHSQTDTFCRTRDNGQVAQLVEARRLERRCCEFDSRPGHHQIICPSCHNMFKPNGKQKFCSRKCFSFMQRKVIRPSKDSLKKDFMDNMTCVAIAKKYGVTDKTIKKWIKYYNIVL